MVSHHQYFQKVLHSTRFYRTSVPFTVSGRKASPTVTLSEFCTFTSLVVPYLVLINARKSDHLLEEILFRKKIQEQVFLKQLTLNKSKIYYTWGHLIKKKKILSCAHAYMLQEH